MKTKLIKLTPEAARKILKGNTINRNVRPSHVDFLANEILAGRWLVTHQGISIADDGTLIDGQHRLLAIIQANIAVEILVTTGAPKETRDAVDTGMCIRGVGDILHMSDGMTEGNLRAAACRLIISMCALFQAPKCSVAMIRIVHDEFKNEFDFIMPLLREFKPAYKGWVLGTLAFCLSGDKRSNEFIEKFSSGEGLKKGEPAKSARDWIVNRNSSALSKKFQKPGVEALCNVVFNSNNGNDVNWVKVGARGLNFFMGKKRGFVDAVRTQIKHQMDCRTERKSGK